jgi:hypothetical protein
LNYILLAREDDPHGNYCGFCGKTNDFADDCGWFYIMSPFDMYEIILKPCCRRCYWIYNDTHIRLYGVGDR